MGKSSTRLTQFGLGLVTSLKETRKVETSTSLRYCSCESINLFSFVCSNLGYALIARVLAEKFANDDFEGWVQRNIFDQLRMTNTGFDLARYLHDHALFLFLLFWGEGRGVRVRWLTDVTCGPFVRLISSNYKVEMYNTGDHLLFP